jgi:neutral trehalase
MSHDEKSRTAPRRFLIDVEETIRLVLEQEDTDGDFQISVTDAGPKILSLGTATSNGFKTFDIRVRSITIPSYLPTDRRWFFSLRARTCCQTSFKSLL